MYGSWFLTTFGVILAVLVLIAVFAVAWTPVFAVLICLVALAFVVAFFVARRSAQRTRDPGSAETGTPASGGVASPAPRPRSGGAPASGEGAAGGGETASTRR